ncbi:TPA: NAD synthetase, partial [Candidatus Marinimicrobia bacterium]|nr:NAD synthetase [Candidatus Neomarinimicrobiota bacterium]
MNVDQLINLVYILAALLFIIGFKKLSSPKTARQGNGLSSLGMLLAVVATLWHQDIIGYEWIIVGFLAGAVIGVISARVVKMTAMPEMVALFNGSGGIASLLVGWSVYHVGSSLAPSTTIPIILSVLIGGVTFTGSLIAWAKLSEVMDGKPHIFKGQHILNVLILLVLLAAGVFLVIKPSGMFWGTNVPMYWIFILLVLVSGILGVLMVIPIGGADMPVVISLLNSFSGLAAAAAGFVISNNVLIVSGALVG